MGKKEEMVGHRAAQLDRLNDHDLARDIAGYFEANRTMPGEKGLKMAARHFLSGGQPVQWDHSRIVDEYASILIKQSRITSPPNQDSIVKKIWDLPDAAFSETDPDTGKAVYSVDVCVGDDGRTLSTGKTGKGTYMGQLPDGFVGNHQDVSGFQAVVMLTDNTGKGSFDGGNIANAGWKLLIDLGQDSGRRPEKELWLEKPVRPEGQDAVPETEQGQEWDDDFAKAVMELEQERAEAGEKGQGAAHDIPGIWADPLPDLGPGMMM